MISIGAENYSTTDNKLNRKTYVFISPTEQSPNAIQSDDRIEHFIDCGFTMFIKHRFNQCVSLNYSLWQLTLVFKYMNSKRESN